MAAGYHLSSRLPQNAGDERMHESRTIEVRKFNPTTSDETFETFFENKRRTGGGEIEKIDADDRAKGIIRVTFVEPGVAENVLSRSDLRLDEALLELSPQLAPLVWDRKTIEVHGLHPTTSYDAVELFFESKRRSGGDAVEHLQLDNNVAVVTFEESGVAERVLQMHTLVLNGAVLTVHPKEQVSSEHSTTGDRVYQSHGESTTGEKAERQSVSSGISVESFEDEEQDPYGSVSDLISFAESTDDTHGAPRESDPVDGMRPDYRTYGHVTPGERAMNKNGRSEIVAGIFETEEQDPRDKDKDVLTMGDSREDTRRTRREPETPLVLTHHMDQDQPEGVRTLRIHGFTPTTSTEAVEMYLENQSGESELDSCDYDVEAGVAVVAFKNPQGAEKLMSLEQLKLGGAQLSVTPLRDVYAGLDVEASRPRAVRVCGIARDTSREFLTLFFENQRMSGGGEIEELEYDNSTGIAIVTFIHPDSARRVVEKQPLKVNNTEVQVTLMTPEKALPVVRGPFEESMVRVTGMSAACTDDDLKTFFSKTSRHNEIHHVTFSQRPGVAMLKFTNPPDFDSLRVLCVTRPLRDTMLSVHQVPVSRLLQVHNIGRVSEDMLSLYFDSKKHSGGGKVVHVSVYREHDYALVEMEDHAIVNDILARGSHKLEDQSMHVTVYYEDLGPIITCQDAPTSTKPIPKTIMVSRFNPDILNFVHSSSISRQIVDGKMADVAAAVGWGNYVTLERSIELTCITSQWEKISHTFDIDWEQTAEDVFLQVLSAHFASEDVLILQELWTGFLERISYVDHLDRNRIVVEVKDNEHRVSIVGQIEEVKNILRRLIGDRAKLLPGLLPTPHHHLLPTPHHHLLPTRQTATESIRILKEHQLRMLSATGFKGKMQKRFPDLTVVIDHRAHSARFTGLPVSIATAQAEMSAGFESLTSTQLDMSATLIKVITGTVVTKHVVQGFKSNNIRAVFHADANRKLGVWAFSEEHLAIAVKVIKSCVDVKKVVANVTAIQSAQKWETLLDRVRSDHEGLLEVTKDEDGVIVSGAVISVDLAVKQIYDFLQQIIVVEKYVSMKRGITAYMVKYMKKEVNDVQFTFRDDNVKVTPKTDAPCGFTVKGSKRGVDGAVSQLRAMARSVKVDRCKVNKPGASAFLSSRDGNRALAGLQAEHKVVVEPVVSSPREDASHTGQSGVDSKVLSSIVLPGGVTVEVVQGNLTNFHADAIVSTANEQLDHVGGLAKAIVTAGGEGIQKQCHAYIREHGKLQPGQVWRSTSGKLPCKALIHAVGPVWRGGESNEEATLRLAISASMTKAEQLDLSSIAFPALSSGVYGFPIDTCTLTIMAALKDFLENHKCTCVKKVSLLDRYETIVKSFGKSLDVTFGSHEATTSEGTAAADDTVQRKGRHETLLTSVNPNVPGASSCSSDIVLETKEGITLSLCKSEMAQMKVDAIVNSTDRELHLDNGGLSGALLQLGGGTLQTECDVAAPDGIEYGEVVSTSGGQLNCQLVVHGACCQWDGGAGTSEQVLRMFVANSFQIAHAHHLASIALPAIGTGTLGFPPEVVAEVMLQELQMFSGSNSQTQLRDVRFVVYEKNVSTTQAFEKTLRLCGLRPAVSPGVQQQAPDRSDKATASSASAKSHKRSRSRKRSVSCNRASASQQQESISCTFDIFARSPAVIARAVKALKQMCDKECTEIVLNTKRDQSAIAKLTNGQMSQIRLLQNTLGVKIDIYKTPSRQRIIICGPAANISRAHAEILQIFIHIVEAEGNERVASVMSKQFQWRYTEGGVFTNYPSTINYQLEIAYQDKKDRFQWKEEGTDDVFLVLFDKMIERSNTKHTSVNVERCVIGDDNDLPANWSTVANTEHVKLEVLEPISHEYQDVNDQFMSSAQGSVEKVIKIERVQNPGLYRQYMLRKEEMKKRQWRPAVIERSLWHGTSADAVQNINMGGFNRSYCGKNATVYGNGVYFAVNSEYSTREPYSTPNVFGEKHVYKSLVLTGDFTAGKPTYRVPPDNPDVPGFKYDTVVDSVNSPGIFVVCLDNQAYPEYLITFC